MFWIGFTDEDFAKAEPEEEGRIGLLVLGKHEERFAVHFWTWSEGEYTEQWRNALIRTLSGKPSALITDMRTPTQSSHLVWWPMWRIEDRIVFHNQLFFFGQHKLSGPPLDIEGLYGLVGESLPKSSDGQALSEWAVSVSDVQEFLAGTSLASRCQPEP